MASPGLSLLPGVRVREASGMDLETDQKLTLPVHRVVGEKVVAGPEP